MKSPAGYALPATRLRMRLRASAACGAAVCSLGLGLGLGWGGPAWGQLGTLGSTGQQGAAPMTGNQPVSFLADRVSYDRDHQVIAADGHVQAWQNDHYLSADRITFDKASGVAAAYGHVVLVEPDGQVLFADYAEVGGGMKSGVLRGMHSILADGGKLAANGARRTDGKLNELSRAVYTSCNLCVDPSKSPEWQIRSNHMVQDLENKRIEYSNAWLDVYGIPLLYIPYMSNTDPSVKRQSGFLPPTIATGDDHLGTYFALPYYWVIDKSTDLLVTPLISSQQGGDLDLDYRERFNDGKIEIRGAIAKDQGTLAGYTYTKADFVWNDTWHYGANVNLGSSVDFLRDYHVEGNGGNFLGSNLFVEGFGVGSYLRIDANSYQALNGTVSQSTLPYVLPRFTYSFFGEPGWLGGRFTLDTSEFNVLRDRGTDDERAAARLQWDRPFAGYFGDRWNLTLQASGAYYNARDFQLQPNFGQKSDISDGTGQVQAAVRLNWPFARDAGSLGTQTIEPILQLIAAPQSGNSLHDRLPNEDSLAYEFTDSTLFALNRFGGYDRYDSGARANIGLHGNWRFLAGQELDALVGVSVIAHQDRNLLPQFDGQTGFNPGAHLSDIVSRVSFVPNKWVDFTARARVDHASGDIRFAETTAGFGPTQLRFGVGYYYESVTPFTEYEDNFVLAGATVNFPRGNAGYQTPNQELGASVNSQIGHYKLSFWERTNTQFGELAYLGSDIRYDDECTAFDIHFVRRYTHINNDHGNTALLFTIIFKTVGQIGFTG